MAVHHKEDIRRDPPVKLCQCGICDTSFRNNSVIEIARAVAKHWNEEHPKELDHSYTPFDEEEYGGHHIMDDIYQVRRREYYITVYDVLAIGRNRIFDESFVKSPEFEDVCEDCWTPIDEVESYEEIDSTGHRDKYLCSDCSKEREVDQRKEENYQLSTFEN